MNGARAAPRVESASVDVTARATALGHLQMAITALETVSTRTSAWIFSVQVMQCCLIYLFTLVILCMSICILLTHIFFKNVQCPGYKTAFIYFSNSLLRLIPCKVRLI